MSNTSLEKKQHPNNLGIKGWAVGGKWGFERYLYTLHRITGLGILAYFLLHILVTSSRVFGQVSWEMWMGIVDSKIFEIGEYLVFVAFGFHALNGIRLILIELGFAVGKAEEPVYPYRSSLNTQRPLMIVIMVLAAALIAIGSYDFFALGAGH